MWWGLIRGPLPARLPAGVVLATGFGALTGAVLGSEVAEHWYQLYKMDKQGANLRFIYWWEDKVSGVLSSHTTTSVYLHVVIQFRKATCAMLHICYIPLCKRTL
jgi:thiamine biosynthesis protein ThiC